MRGPAASRDGTSCMYDYGECHVCGERMEERRVKQEFWVKGKLIVIKDVPAGVCPQCGEKVVKADIGRWIAKLIENSERISKAPRISVPAIKFNAKEAAHIEIGTDTIYFKIRC